MKIFRSSSRPVQHVPALWLSSTFALAAVVLASADYKDDVGYTRLQLELGAAMPTGSGVTVSQVEAPPQGTTDYQPDLSNSEFTGKTYTPKSGSSGVSGHATVVAAYFFGNSAGLAPGITTIDGYEANAWIGSGMLNRGGGDPKSETRDVTNSSWIGTTTDSATDQEIIRRFDYSIDQSNYVAVVGTNNGAGNALPPLLAHNYNGITVGLTNGDHASGPTSFDTAGRVKPDIVAPLSATSFATPLVGGAAADLIQTARGNAALANGADSRSVKAILLAGATKSEFPAWSRTTARPLDARYGAGELNLYNSYHILAAGEKSPGTTSTVGTQGWDFGTVSTANLLYFFDVPAGFNLTDFSAALTWNRIITDGNILPTVFTPNASLDNLDLKLFNATNFTLGTMLDSSVSAVDNVEYIAQVSLAPGRYALELDHGTGSTVFSLAWTGNLIAVPELSSAWLVAVGLGLLGVRRARR